jgi:hypothetical protein
MAPTSNIRRPPSVLLTAPPCGPQSQYRWPPAGLILIQTIKRSNDQTIKRHANRSLTNLIWVFLGHNRILSLERKRQEIRDP